MVIGGVVAGEGFTASVILYDPQTDTWADGPPLPSPRKGCRAVEHAGAVVLIGGGPALRFKDGAWFPITDLPARGQTERPALGTVLLG